MNEDFTDLEQELKRLRPRSVPAPLLGRIGRELAAGRPAKRGVLAQWRSWIIPVAASAALAVTVTSIPFIMRERGAGTPAQASSTANAPRDAAPGVAASLDTPSRLRPVRATNVLYDAVNEGVVRLEDNTLARRMRLNYLDTITWENPQNGAQLQRTVPREEILFIPVTAN